MRAIERANLVDRFEPGFDVELGRNERRDGRSGANADTGDVAAENVVVPMVDMMMTGVSRSFDGANLKLADPHNVVVLHNPHAIGRDFLDFPPKPFHVVTENARSRFDQLRGINEMRRTARMDVDSGPTGSKTPGGAGVIEMNVAKKDMAHVLDLEAGLAESGHNIVERGFRTGIEKGEAVIGFERGRGDDAGAAELVSVDDVEHFWLLVIGYRLLVIGARGKVKEVETLRG